MKIRRVHVIQGQSEVSRAEPNCCLTTLLGSCISVCLFDPLARTGGMNHFLLASGRTGGLTSASYGVNAMELLINGVLKLGASRHRLRAHVFGGARMLSGLGSIGDQNAAFTTEFLRNEGIRVLTNSTGGTLARRVNFWPDSGVAKEEFIKRAVAERALIEEPALEEPTGDIELF